MPALLPKTALPYLAVMTTGLMLATVPILVRMAQAEQVPSLTIASLRVAMAVLILSPHALRHHRHEMRHLGRRDLTLISVAGLCGALFFVFFFNSLAHTSVLIASVLNGTQPLWVAVMEVVLLRTLLRRRVWMGLALVLAGTTLFVIPTEGSGIALGDQPVLGGALALLAALVGACHFIAGREVRRRVSTMTYLWLSLVVALLISLGFVLAAGDAIIGFAPSAYLWILLMAIGAQVIGHFALAYALAHIPATLAAIISQSSVIISGLLALALFQEYPQPLQLVASLLILMGIALVILQPRPQPAPG